MADETSPLPAHVVGYTFVSHYYRMLLESPVLVCEFYEEHSRLGRPKEDGSMSIIGTMEGIREKLVSLMYDKVEIKHIDSLGSFDSGFHVLVTGSMTGKDEIPKRFSQFLFLAPRLNGLFVFNDLLRFPDRASPVQEEAPVSKFDEVGKELVMSYYELLTTSPWLCHRFYEDISRVGRPEEDGSMSITTTLKGIRAKLVSHRYYKSVEIKYVDSVNSLCGGVHVLVNGFMTGKNKVTKKFTQYFFLTPKNKGFILLNDILRLTDSDSHRRNALAVKSYASTLMESKNNVVPSASPMSRGGSPGVTRNHNTSGRGGRGYNRGPEFDVNRNNYGYRDGNSRRGASNRGGGDGYERNNNGGGRVNRGADVNGTVTRNTSK